MKHLTSSTNVADATKLPRPHQFRLSTVLPDRCHNQEEWACMAVHPHLARRSETGHLRLITLLRLPSRGHLRCMERTPFRTYLQDNTNPSLLCPPYLCGRAYPRRRFYICPWSRRFRPRPSMAGFLPVCLHGRARAAQRRDIATAGMAGEAS